MQSFRWRDIEANQVMVDVFLAQKH